MYVLRREELAYLFQNLVKHFEIALLGGAPCRTVFIVCLAFELRWIVAQNFRVYPPECTAVSGQVNLGYDFDIACAGILYQFLKLLLREIPAITLAPFAIYGLYRR